MLKYATNRDRFADEFWTREGEPPDVGEMHPCINYDEWILKQLPKWRSEGLSPRVIYPRDPIFRDCIHIDHDFNERRWESESRCMIELLRCEVYLNNTWWDEAYRANLP